jgi:hypothetical protein
MELAEDRGRLEEEDHTVLALISLAISDLFSIGKSTDPHTADHRSAVADIPMVAERKPASLGRVEAR